VLERRYPRQLVAIEASHFIESALGLGSEHDELSKLSLDSWSGEFPALPEFHPVAPGVHRDFHLVENLMSTKASSGQHDALVAPALIAPTRIACAPARIARAGSTLGEAAASWKREQELFIKAAGSHHEQRECERSLS
jgi:hypothetical protein